MKLFVRCWLIAVFIAAPATVQAAGCRAVVVRRVEKVVVEKVVAAVVAPVVATFVAVPIPAYFATYQPGYVPPAPVQTPPMAPACEDNTATFRQIAGLLQQLDARLQRIEGGKANPAIPPMPPADGGKPADPRPNDPFNPMGQPQTQGQGQAPDRLLALASRACGSCHDRSRAAAAGKGFVLLEGGKFAPNLSAEDAGKVVEAVSKKTMPKNGNMSDADRLEFLALLVGGK